MPIYERMTVKGRAGALQTYQGGQQAVAPGGTSARVSGEAGAIYARGAAQEGQALGNLAGAIGKAGHTFNAAYEDYSKTKATELFNKYRDGMNQAMDGENGILSQVGESAFHAGQQTLGTSHGLRSDLIKDYGENDRVTQIFNQLVAPHENAYHIRAQQHGEKEYRLWQDRTDDAAAKGYFDEALAGISDPQAFAQGTAGALWHVEQQLRRKGYSGEALERGLLEASSRIYKSGIAQAISDKDFSSADRLLGEGSAHMTEADRLDMQGKIQAGRERETLEQMQLLADAGDVEGLKRLKEQVEQGTAFGAATQGLNAGIAAQAAQWGGGKVKYYRDDTGRTPRDPRRGQIDCSGWVGWTLEQNGIKGFRSLNAEGQIDEAWKRGARQLSQQEVLASPRENMLVCIDTGQKGFDRGRAKGIDHVVLTYRDPQTGQLMVTESSGSKGVRSIPWEKWAAQYPRATFYGADLSTMKGADAASPAGGRRPYGDLKLNEANNNPGNISGSGGVGRGYKAYDTTLEGFKALDELIRTKYAGMTPAQLAEKYAPAGDPRGQNDPIAYAIQIAGDLGMIPEDAKPLAKKAMDGDREARAEMMQYIDGDAKIDVSDKHVRSKLMRSIAKREGPTGRFNLDEIDYVTGVKEMPAGYQSKDLRKESREQPGQDGNEGASPGYLTEPTRLKLAALMEKGGIRRRQDAVLADFAQEPQKGMELLATEEGRALYGMRGKEAAETMSLLNTLWTQQKNMEKAAREEHERDAFTEVVNLALGAGGKQADPLSAYRMIINDESLDGKTKLEILKSLESGVIGKDDPAYVANIKTKIAAGEPVPDSELARAMAAGQLSSKTKEEMLKLRELAGGPQKAMVKAAFEAIDTAFRKSMMADGTPEQANARYAATFELQAVIEQAQKDGTVMQLLDPNSPRYVLPGIIQRHTLNMQQQVAALQKKFTQDGAAQKPSEEMLRQGETYEDYQKRMASQGKAADARRRQPNETIEAYQARMKGENAK